MSEQVCSWCESEAIQGRQEDTGRPLTAAEKEAGFLAVHKECEPHMDALFARLASRGVFVEITDKRGGDNGE